MFAYLFQKDVKILMLTIKLVYSAMSIINFSMIHVKLAHRKTVNLSIILGTVYYARMVIMLLHLSVSYFHPTAKHMVLWVNVQAVNSTIS
jgi:hypothetical protein